MVLCRGKTAIVAQWIESIDTEHLLLAQWVHLKGMTGTGLSHVCSLECDTVDR